MNNSDAQTTYGSTNIPVVLRITRPPVATNINQRRAYEMDKNCTILRTSETDFKKTAIFLTYTPRWFDLCRRPHTL